MKITMKISDRAKSAFTWARRNTDAVRTQKGRSPILCGWTVLHENCEQIYERSINFSMQHA